MLCDLRRLLELTAGGSIELDTYLHQKTLTRAHAWGFTLGVARWNISGRDKKELSEVRQKNVLTGRERIAYLGMRGYEGEWFSDKVNWTVHFNAQMKNFALQPAPHPREFEYGLNFNWTWKEKRLSESELRDYLDYAVIWRILSGDNVGEVIERVRDDFNREAEVSVQFTIKDSVLRALLPLAVAAGDRAGARALAKAMPYISDYDARRSPKLREECYAGLWKRYFDEDSLPIEIYPRIAGNAIDQMSQLKDEKALANRERGFFSSAPAYQDPFTFSGQIFINGSTVEDHSGIHKDWLKFIGGIKALRDALDPAGSAGEKTVETVFKQMSAFWKQTLYVRAAGVFLLDLAAGAGLLDEINRTCTIAFKRSDVFVFAASA